MRKELKENKKIYEEVIANLVHLFEKIGISDNPVLLAGVFNCLCQNNYLSIREYSREIPDSYIAFEKRTLPIDICGMYILDGYGVCRHLTDFLFCIYEKLGYDSSKIFLYHPNISVSVCGDSKSYDYISSCVNNSLSSVDVNSLSSTYFVDKYDDIEVEIKYDAPSVLNFMYGNHVLNTVKDSKVHIVDLSQDVVGNMLDSERVMFYKDNYTYIDYLIRDSYLSSTYYSHGIYLYDNYDGNVLLDIINYSKADDVFYENISVFNSFYDENEHYYNMISLNNKKLIKNNKLYYFFNK